MTTMTWGAALNFDFVAAPSHRRTSELVDKPSSSTSSFLDGCLNLVPTVVTHAHARRAALRRETRRGLPLLVSPRLTMVARRREAKFKSCYSCRIADTISLGRSQAPGENIVALKKKREREGVLASGAVQVSLF